MKTNRGIASLTTGLGIAVYFLATMPAAEAATINFTTVRSGLASWEALAVDPGTGQVFERANYDASTTAVRVYANMAAFAANTPSATLTLTPGTFYGTYISASQGQLYGRTDNSTSAAATWSTSTGAQSSTISGYSGMGGINGSDDTFDWGGYSGVNFMQDSTGRYVVGGVASNNNWQIEHLGIGLNPVSTIVYTPIGDPALGWGFIINGTLFTGENYSSNIVSNAVNVNTGAVSSISDTLAGLGGNYYLSDFSYDYASDTLYAFNTNTGTLYQAGNASVQFGVGSAVPEPASLALLALGLAGLGFSRRKKA